MTCGWFSYQWTGRGSQPQHQAAQFMQGTYQNMLAPYNIGIGRSSIRLCCSFTYRNINNLHEISQCPFKKPIIFSEKCLKVLSAI